MSLLSELKHRESRAYGEMEVRETLSDYLRWVSSALGISDAPPFDRIKVKFEKGWGIDGTSSFLRISLPAGVDQDVVGWIAQHSDSRMIESYGISTSSKHIIDDRHWLNTGSRQTWNEKRLKSLIDAPPGTIEIRGYGGVTVDELARGLHSALPKLEADSRSVYIAHSEKWGNLVLFGDEHRRHNDLVDRIAKLRADNRS